MVRKEKKEICPLLGGKAVLSRKAGPWYVLVFVSDVSQSIVTVLAQRVVFSIGQRENGALFAIF